MYSCQNANNLFDVEYKIILSHDTLVRQCTLQYKSANREGGYRECDRETLEMQILFE